MLGYQKRGGGGGWVCQRKSTKMAMFLHSKHLNTNAALNIVKTQPFSINGPYGAT